MNIILFNSITTNEQLDALKLESEKYTGLYVDMEDSKQRKYVKDKADHINQLLKKVDRKRIDSVKEFKLNVEAEAADIKERLEIANLPFTLLIDEHKAERKRILDKEKAEREAIELAVEIEAAHEFALLMNDKFDTDKIKAEQERKQHEEEIKAEAIKEQAAQAERDRIAAIEREEQQKQELIAVKEKAEKDAILASLKRERDIEQAKQDEIARQQAEQARIEEDARSRAADTEHKDNVNRAILAVLVENGISDKDARTMIDLAYNELLPNLTINY